MSAPVEDVTQIHGEPELCTLWCVNPMCNTEEPLQWVGAAEVFRNSNGYINGIFQYARCWQCGTRYSSYQAVGSHPRWTIENEHIYPRLLTIEEKRQFAPPIHIKQFI